MKLPVDSPRRAEKVPPRIPEGHSTPERSTAIVERYRLVLPIELTNGNEGRSKHWGSAAERRKDYEVITRSLYGRVRAVTPVRLVITRVLGPGQRLYDADSLGRGNAKEVIDALVAVGVLLDDGPRHVVSCEYRQDAANRLRGPATVVEIEAVS